MKPVRLVAVTAFPALMLDFHLNSFHFLVANVLIAGWILVRRQEARKLGWLAVGGLVAVPFLVAARFVPEPGAMLSLLGSGNPFSAVTVYASTQPSGGMGRYVFEIPSHLLDFIPWWIDSYVRPPLFEGLPQGLFFLFGFITAWFGSQNSHHRVLAVYYLLASISFAALVTFKWSNYSVPWMPLLLLLGTAGAKWIQDHGRSIPTNPFERWRWHIGVGILCFLWAVYLAGDVYILRIPRNERFIDVANQLRQIIPSGSSILTETTWWYALPDTKLIDEHLAITGLQPVPYYLTSPLGPAGFIRQDVLEELRPKYVFTDDLIGCENDVSPGGLALSAEVAGSCKFIRSYLVDRPDGTTRQTRLYECPRP
jgi:hypothetical protein